MYLDQLAVEIQQLAEPGAPMAAAELPLYRLYALLCLTAGTATTLRDVHDAWAVWAIEHKPQSRYIMPFGELPPVVQEMDEPYARAICNVAARGIGGW